MMTLLAAEKPVVWFVIAASCFAGLAGMTYALARGKRIGTPELQLQKYRRSIGTLLTLQVLLVVRLALRLY
jgi:hypothetical protein